MLSRIALISSQWISSSQISQVNTIFSNVMWKAKTEVSTKRRVGLFYTAIARDSSNVCHLSSDANALSAFVKLGIT